MSHRMAAMGSYRCRDLHAGPARIAHRMAAVISAVEDVGMNLVCKRV